MAEHILINWHRMLYSCTHMATVGIKGLQKCCWWCDVGRLRLQHSDIQGFLEWGDCSGRGSASSNHVVRDSRYT